MMDRLSHFWQLRFQNPLSTVGYTSVDEWKIWVTKSHKPPYSDLAGQIKKAGSVLEFKSNPVKILSRNILNATVLILMLDIF